MPLILLIPPTVGRRVWYRPLSFEKSYTHDQPFDAGIVHVVSDSLVHLAVTNELGYPLHSKHNVVLRETWEQAQPGECAWMPFQTGQAKSQAPTAVGADMRGNQAGPEAAHVDKVLGDS